MLHTLQGKGGLNKRQVACTLDWQSITCKKPGGSSKSNLMMNLRTVRNISRDPGNNTKVRLSVCLSVSVCVCVSVSLCLYVSVFLPPYPCLSASLSLFVPPCDSHRIAILIISSSFLPPFFPLHSSPSNPKSSRILGSSHTRTSRSAKSGFSRSRLFSGATANGPTCWPGHDQAA